MGIYQDFHVLLGILIKNHRSVPNAIYIHAIFQSLGIHIIFQSLGIDNRHFRIFQFQKAVFLILLLKNAAAYITIFYWLGMVLYLSIRH